MVNPFWLVLSYFVCVLGELCLSPVGLSATTKLAPAAFSAQTMSLWFLSNAAAQAINAQIVKFYTPATEMLYFGIIGGASIVLSIHSVHSCTENSRVYEGCSLIEASPLQQRGTFFIDWIGGFLRITLFGWKLSLSLGKLSIFQPKLPFSPPYNSQILLGQRTQNLVPEKMSEKSLSAKYSSCLFLMGCVMIHQVCIINLR